jgi:hypothetical protein
VTGGIIPRVPYVCQKMSPEHVLPTTGCTNVMGKEIAKATGIQKYSDILILQ